MVYKYFYFWEYIQIREKNNPNKIYIINSIQDNKMVITSRENTVGAWAFLMGVVLAILIGLSTSLISIPTITRYSSVIYAILVILGLVVGFMNIRGRDTQTFLLAGAVLVIVSKFGMEGVNATIIGIKIGLAISQIFAALLILFVPATIIVALKTVFEMAKI